tara:strand:- start:1546 stop:2220 length:675 start_codon:yes stop_codon:yes gene_type:complete
MKEFNLLEVSQSVKRDLSLRSNITFQDRVRSATFGYDYFDGDRKLGYGGYIYDGRWVKVAERAVKLFNLKPGDKVLDIGCAKGFFVHDLIYSFDLDAYGVDVSTYALLNAMPSIAGRLHLQNMNTLLFPDDTFDAIFCINALHNLDKVDAFGAIQEMNRVVKDKQKIFIQVDSYRDNEDLTIFENWVLTAKLYMQPENWLKFFEASKFEGAYFWTILRKDGSVE